MDSYVTNIGGALLDRGLTIGTVESATGGLIAHTLTNISGSSGFYKGSVVSYSNEIKTCVVGVKAESIEENGAVSAAVAEQMADGGRRLLCVDICISDTGIAGPNGGTPVKPVGLFYLGFSCKNGTFSREYRFQGNRTENKQAAATAALEWLQDYLTGKWVP